MKKLPYLQFYIGDWLKDPQLSICSPATRGVWIDLLCAMHEAGRVGSLSGTRDQLSRLARCVPADLALALTDLQTTGAADVTERNGVVTLTNRRMARDAKKREGNALRQSRYRTSSESNAGITPLSPPLYEGETETEFVSSFPEVLQTEEFRTSVFQWLNYKRARGENYQPQGRAAMLSRAAKLAESHGLKAVIDAMERAMGNNWQGWDQPSMFGAVNGQQAKRPRQRVRLSDDNG
jgi:hypothetical protein